MSAPKILKVFLAVLKVLGYVLVAAVCLFLTVIIPFLTQEIIDLIWDNFTINPDFAGYLVIAVLLLVAVLDFLFPYLMLRLFKLRPKWPWLVIMGIITTFWTLFVFWLGTMVRD